MADGCWLLLLPSLLSSLTNLAPWYRLGRAESDSSWRMHRIDIICPRRVVRLIGQLRLLILCCIVISSTTAVLECMRAFFLWTKILATLMPVSHSWDGQQ